MENIEVPDPILWYEGMPLYPHHFQQESIRFQSLFQTYLLAVGKYNYGVFEMDIDRLALGKNVFKLNKIFAIMPDGLVIKSDSYKTNFEYALPDPTTADKMGLGIYVALPKLIANNYILGKYPRYRKDEIPDILDFNTGEDATDVPRMAPNIILGSDLDLNTNFVKLKIAHLSVDKNMWDFQDYVAPTVRVNEDSDLYDVCSEICYGFRKKLNYIAELVFAKGSARQASFISEYFFYAQGLSSALPVLEGLLQTQDVHPYQLYLALCQILGGLSLLTKELTPPFPLPYEHEELLKTFTRMKKEIDEIVNAVIDEKMTKQNFIEEHDVYSTIVRAEAIEKNWIYIGARKEPDCTELDFLNWMEHAIICESHNIELSIHNRILGRFRESIEKTDDILPTRGVYLFKVMVQESPDDPPLDSISLAILNPDDKENAPDEIFLYVPKKKGKKK